MTSKLHSSHNQPHLCALQITLDVQHCCIQLGVFVMQHNPDIIWMWDDVEKSHDAIKVMTIFIVNNRGNLYCYI